MKGYMRSSGLESPSDCLSCAHVSQSRLFTIQNIPKFCQPRRWFVCNSSARHSLGIRGFSIHVYFTIPVTISIRNASPKWQTLSGSWLGVIIQLSRPLLCNQFATRLVNATARNDPLDPLAHVTTILCAAKRNFTATAYPAYFGRVEIQRLVIR